jgi:uncharacterized membrane protein (UPF0127 family)
MRILLTAAMLLSTLAVTPVQAATPCPNVGLRTTQVVFETAKGRFSYRLEVAATTEQQACGMMFRESMAPGTGMSFPMQPPRATGFWMENTILPLDLIFVSPLGRVLNVRQGRPYSRDVLSSEGITADVIELAAGEAKRIGLQPGDRVRR